MNRVADKRQPVPSAIQIAIRLAVRDVAKKLVEQNNYRGDLEMASEWSSLAQLAEREIVTLSRSEGMQRASLERN